VRTDQEMPPATALRSRVLGNRTDADAEEEREVEESTPDPGRNVGVIVGG
jgi:hypothetical protein